MKSLYLKNSRNFTHQNFSKKNRGGFTLIEMIVSLGLFTIIMFIATSAFLSIVNTDRKARGVRIAADNLNVTLEDMSRRIKTGTTYYCGESATGTNDCTITPGTAFSFNDQNSNRTVYKWAQGSTCSAAYTATQGCILRSDSPVPITSPEIDITDLKFFVLGSTPAPDKKQPVVIIVISGTLGGGSTASSFKIQTTITQRAYDN